MALKSFLTLLVQISNYSCRFVVFSCGTISFCFKVFFVLLFVGGCSGSVLRGTVILEVPEIEF